MLRYNQSAETSKINETPQTHELFKSIHSGMTRAEKITRFKLLTEVLLPAQAQEQAWPIRLDHCFKRICLDLAFSDVWYKHLKRPAKRYIDGEPLTRALECAEGSRAKATHCSTSATAPA